MLTLSFKHLPQVLKFIKKEKLAGLLIAQSNNTPAALVFSAGKLVHAQYSTGALKQEGDEAVYSMLAWEDGSFNWKPGAVAIDPTIDDDQAITFQETVEFLAGNGSFEVDSLEEFIFNEFFGVEVVKEESANVAQERPVATPAPRTAPPQPVVASSTPVSTPPPAPASSKTSSAPTTLSANPKTNPATNTVSPVPANLRKAENTSKANEPEQTVLAAEQTAQTGGLRHLIGNTGELNPNSPPIQEGPAVTTLIRMGVPRLVSRSRVELNSHFANSLEIARQLAGSNWAQVVQIGRLPQTLLRDTPDASDEYETPVDYLSRINYAFEKIFGAAAPEKIRDWGRLATERAINARKSSGMEQNVIRVMPGKHRKLNLVLTSFMKTMDTVRGEKLHTFKQIDQNQYWIVHYNNLYALGRRTPVNSCYVWTASYEALLRWGGLANDWFVEEVECGCVTGSWDCVFAIRAV